MEAGQALGEEKTKLKEKTRECEEEKKKADEASSQLKGITDAAGVLQIQLTQSEMTVRELRESVEEHKVNITLSPHPFDAHSPSRCTSSLLLPTPRLLLRRGMS